MTQPVSTRMASSQTGNEDLFLSLAADSPTHNEGEARQERRRSRILSAGRHRPGSRAVSVFGADDAMSDYNSVAGYSASEAGRSGRRASAQGFIPDQTASSPWETASVYNRDYGSRHFQTPRHSTAYSANPLNDTFSSRPLSSRRRTSVTDRTSVARSIIERHRLSNSYSQMGDNDSVAESIAREKYFDAPESIGTDPGSVRTVWDDLADLKEQAKRLERKASFPKFNGDRPYPEASTEEHSRHRPSDMGVHAHTNIHPNLHLALAKAKLILSPAIYNSLELVAKDALQLAATSGSPGSQGTASTAASILTGFSSSDRQIRRRADNMCRSVTDLCITLCDAHSDYSSRYPRAQASGRPNSRDHSSAEPSPLVSLEQRGARLDFYGDRLSSRSSLNRSGYRADSRTTTYDGPATLNSSSSVPYRSSSRYSGVNGYLSLDLDEEDDSVIRPPSRAMTDADRRPYSTRQPSRYTSRREPMHDLSGNLRPSRRRGGSADLNFSSPSPIGPYVPSPSELNPGPVDISSGYSNRGLGVATASQLGSIDSASRSSRVLREYHRSHEIADDSTIRNGA